MKKSKGPTAEQSQQLSDQERQRQYGAIDTAQQAINPYLPGSQGMSEYRQGLTSRLKSANATAGEQALNAIRQRAAAAGFDFQQPITTAAEQGAQITNAQAGAQIPFEVAQAAAPIEQQAAQQQLGLARLYDPESYYRLAAQQAEQERQRKGGIWGTLAKIGLAGASAIPGLGTVGKVASAAGGAF